MSRSYRVFTGAPLASSTRKPIAIATSWQTVSSRAVSPPLLPATLEQAGLRLSLIYRNVIFDESNEAQEDLSEEWDSQDVLGLTSTQSADLSTRSGNSSVKELSHFQETCDTDQTGDETTMFSEGSSISRFPTFNFNLNSVSSLAAIMNPGKPGGPSNKVTLLLGVLEVDGPSYVTVKTGAYAGSEVGLLKLVVGDERGAVCKLIAWREIAELWGGIEKEPGLKRGDIVLFENVIVPRPHTEPREQDPTLQITASPNLKSQAQICYRTLPHTYDDRKLRPDLRLADSVQAVRRVSEVVTWMERMAGIVAKR